MNCLLHFKCYCVKVTYDTIAFFQNDIVTKQGSHFHFIVTDFEMAKKPPSYYFVWKKVLVLKFINLLLQSPLIVLLHSIQMHTHSHRHTDKQIHKHRNTHTHTHIRLFWPNSISLVFPQNRLNHFMPVYLISQSS